MMDMRWHAIEPTLREMDATQIKHTSEAPKE
jgi:hypothetical protein